MLNFLIFEKMFSKSIETNETEKKNALFWSAIFFKMTDQRLVGVLFGDIFYFIPELIQTIFVNF